MRLREGPWAVLAEAWRSVRSQPVTSVVVAALFGAVCLAVLLTSGRAVAAEEDVLASIDAAGTRAIVVRAPADSPLPASTVDLLDQVQEIEEVTGLGPLVDARNLSVPGGPGVPVRPGYGTIGGRLLAGERPHEDVTSTWASDRATRELGLLDRTGSAVSSAGGGLSVTAGLTVPDHLALAEPLLLIPSSVPGRPSGRDPLAPLTLLVVVTDRPQDVEPVADLVHELVRDDATGQVTVETSQELAEIRAAVSGELGEYGRSTILGVLALGIVLLGTALLAQMNSRRKDFGRRRALGASQSLIVALVLTQVALPALIGIVLGTAAALGWLTLQDQPVPGPAFTTAVSTAALLSVLLAAVVPALIAARRDPLHELRVP